MFRWQVVMAIAGLSVVCGFVTSAAQAVVTAEQDALMSNIVANRRSVGPRTVPYPSEWRSTMPFERRVGEVLGYFVRRAAPVMAAVLVADAALGAFTTGSLVEALIYAVILAVVIAALLTAMTARAVRRADVQSLRVVLRPDGAGVPRRRAPPPVRDGAASTRRRRRGHPVR